METLKTIRMQLSAIEAAHRDRRLTDAAHTLATLSDLVEILRDAFFEEERKGLRVQLERLVQLGMVVEDLEERLAQAEQEKDVFQLAYRLEKLWRLVEARIDTHGKLLLRTNIFSRGKKLLVSVDSGDTLADLASDLKLQFAGAIGRYLTSHAGRDVDPGEVEIGFYGAVAFEDPNRARLSPQLSVEYLVAAREGVFWFPEVAGITPTWQGDGEDNDEALMEVLENFTIEANLNSLEEQLSRVAEEMEPAPASSHWRARASLVRTDPRSLEEERIPLVGEQLTIGRSRENDIQILGDPKVSRFHCRISRDGDHWKVEDCGSSNGTRVGSDTVKHKTLEVGDVVHIGRHEFRFEVDET